MTWSSVRSTRVRSLRGIGNIGSPPWAGAVCACKSPRIGPPAGTSATPATSAKQAHSPIPSDGRTVDAAAMPEPGDSGSLKKNRPTPAFVLARAFALTAPAWLPVSGSSRATTAGAAAALVLTTSERLASTGRVELSRGALEGVVHAIRAIRGAQPSSLVSPQGSLLCQDASAISANLGGVEGDSGCASRVGFRGVIGRARVVEGRSEAEDTPVRVVEAGFGVDRGDLGQAARRRVVTAGGSGPEVQPGRSSIGMI